MPTLESESLSLRSAETAPVLETRSLTRRFGTLTAVDQLGIAIAPGEIFGLVGPNGAGKTTVIKMLTTLLPPSSGSASVADHDIGHHPAEVRRVIGYVPQLVSADGSLTGFENLLIFSKLYDVSRAERRERISDSLTFMGLAQVGDKLVRNYSGGMIRRLHKLCCIDREFCFSMSRPLDLILWLGKPCGSIFSDYVMSLALRFS